MEILGVKIDKETQVDMILETLSNFLGSSN